jgi:hypothetical protein
MTLNVLRVVTAVPLALAIASLYAAAPAPAPPANGPVNFQPHDIGQLSGGYAVLTADFNKDGKLDVIANSLGVAEVAWYENPTWQRHVIVPERRSVIMNAMNDLDGDGIPEIAFQNAFAMRAANSEGFVSIARSQGGDPRQPWKVEQIDKYPTSHHIAWADLDGDGKRELLNAPLIGPKSLAPAYDQDKASVFWYTESDGWKRHIVTESIPGIIHRARPVRWDNNTRDQFLIASFEGVALYRATGSGASMTFDKTLLTAGHVTGPAPRLGSSDVGVGMQNGRRFFATVEPWHGNEVVVYNEQGGTWIRRVIYDQLASGHEIAVADLNGDGRADAIANDNCRLPGAARAGGGGRGRGADGAGRGDAAATANPGVHVFYAPDEPAAGEWVYQRVESQQGMNGCVAADINNDTRPDLVCTGSGGVVRWYENVGVGSGSGAAR